MDKREEKIQELLAGLTHEEMLRLYRMLLALNKKEDTQKVWGGASCECEAKKADRRVGHAL